MRDHRPAVAGAVTWLRRQGLVPGDRLVTLLANTHDTFALGLACMLEGVVQVPLPPDLVDDDLRRVVDDADPALVLADPAVARDADAIADRDRRHPRTRPMAYTSGTTGRRKGVHVGVHDDAWGCEVVDDEHAAFDRRHGDRHLVVSPLYHSGPFRFAAITALTGAPCPVPLKERLLALAPDDVVWEFHGSTEGQFTVCPPDLWQRAPGTVGAAREGRRLHLRDVRDDGVGTVWVEAPAHARWEYWRAPDRTREAWDGDAFTVGDLGRLERIDGLQAFARERLRRAQVPRRIHVVADLPRTPTGKVARVGLAEAVGR